MLGRRQRLMTGPDPFVVSDQLAVAIRPHPGQISDDLDWPYIEGLRMDEAMHPLALLCFGMYGEVLPNQDGAPLRVVLPWKYGFKSAKAIVKIRFTDQQPVNSWSKSAPSEYGFYSNVNPHVDHPRWSQASERRLGEFFGTRTADATGQPVDETYYYPVRDAGFACKPNQTTVRLGVVKSDGSGLEWQALSKYSAADVLFVRVGWTPSSERSLGARIIERRRRRRRNWPAWPRRGTKSTMRPVPLLFVSPWRRARRSGRN